jgi:hypothetical protein
MSNQRTNIDTLRLIAYSKQDRIKREVLNGLWEATTRPLFTIPEPHRVGYIANELDELFDVNETEFWKREI